MEEFPFCDKCELYTNGIQKTLILQKNDSVYDLVQN